MKPFSPLPMVPGRPRLPAVTWLAVGAVLLNPPLDQAGRDLTDRLARFERDHVVRRVADANAHMERVVTVVGEVDDCGLDLVGPSVPAFLGGRMVDGSIGGVEPWWSSPLVQAQVAPATVQKLGGLLQIDLVPVVGPFVECGFDPTHEARTSTGSGSGPSPAGWRG